MATTLPPTPPFGGLPTETRPAAVAPRPDARVPGTPSAAMAKAHARAKRVRDVLGGIDTLRAGGEAYLPRLTGESDADYAFRLQLAGFFNAPRRLVKAMAGLIFQRDPVVGDDGGEDPARAIDPETGEPVVPDTATGTAPDPSRARSVLEDHWEAWDDHGTHGAVTARRLCEAGIALGFAGLLTDMPARPDGPLSAADAQSLALRPYQVPIRIEQIMRARWVMLGAQRVLVYLELRETGDSADAGADADAADGTPLVRYRVFTRAVTRTDGGRVVRVGAPLLQLWEQREHETTPTRVGEPIALSAKGGGALSAIPFSPFLAGDHDETDEDADEEWLLRSPIQDLIDLALTWYQVFSERRNLTNRACTQTPWLKGYVPQVDAQGNVKPLRMGPSEAILLNGENAGAGFLSPNADGFEPTERDLEALERRMAAMGLAFLMSETRAAETAEGKRIDAAAQNASLAAIARELQDCLERAMGFHAEFLGVEPVSVTINTDFERIVADPTMIDALSRLAQTHQITLETLLALLERWRVLPDGFDAAREVAALDRLAASAPAPDATGAGSTGGGVLDRMAQALAGAATAPLPSTTEPTR